MSRRSILLSLFLITLFARSADAQWGPNAAPVCIAANAQSNPRVATDGAGGAIFVWDDARSLAEAAVYIQKLNSAGSAQWTNNGVLVATVASRPRVISDGAGGAIVAWRDTRSGAIGVYAQRFNSSGAPLWTAGGVRLSTTFGDPEIDLDGAGGAVVAWSAGVQPTRDVYAQRVASNGAVLWAAGGLTVCRHPQDQVDVAIAGIGAGAAIVSWLDHRDATHRVFARGISVAGDTLWTPLGLALSPSNPAAFRPATVADGANGVYVAVPDQRQAGQGTHIYLYRLTGAGATSPGWPAGGVDLGVGYTGGDPNLVMIREALGGVLLTQHGGHVNHVTAAGTEDWFADATQVTNAFDSPLFPRLVPDLGGGAIVGWHDIRTQVDYDAWATQIQWDGALNSGCPLGGESLTTFNGSQTEVTGCPDGLSGAIFGWRDARSDGGNIFANHTTCATAVGVGNAPLALVESLRLEQNPSFGARRAVVTLGPLATDEPAILTLHDVAGRVVARHTIAPSAAGQMLVDLDPGRRLAPGTYFLQLRHGNCVIAHKATFLR